MQFYKFQKSSFKGGFLECIFSFCQLVTKNVRPTFKELEIFSTSLMMDPGSYARFNWYCDELLNSLRIGDCVTINEGECKGLVGNVADTKDGIAQVLLTREANVNLDRD